MGREASWGLALLCIGACNGSAPAAPAPAPPASDPAPAPQATPTPAAGPANPCANPAPITLELSAGVRSATPWELEFSYVIDEDKKRGSGYMFMLRSGERRWETRRDNTNWTTPLTWRGFCWRGGERPERKATQLKIQIAPVCKDGKLQELGGCAGALGPG